MKEISRDFHLRWVSDGYTILHKSPGHTMTAYVLTLVSLDQSSQSLYERQVWDVYVGGLYLPVLIIRGGTIYVANVSTYVS